MILFSGARRQRAGSATCRRCSITGEHTGPRRRTTPQSKLYAFEAGKRAIEGNLKRCGADATVTHTKDFGFYRVTYAVKEQTLVSVIIPNKDHADVLKKCLDSVRKKRHIRIMKS